MIAEERAVLALTEELHAKEATLGDAYNYAVMGAMGAIFAQAVGREYDIELAGDYSQISPEELGAIYEETIGFKPCIEGGKVKLQPGEERRRSGSHYTPRELTWPIVETTFRPILEALGERPTAEQILELKVCDPAMGSGAFLVEATRQLGDQLVKAWENHDSMPAMPADEDPILHARRLVAQRCIYGVDKNPCAVSLAKLALLLLVQGATTRIGDNLRYGDALVGLTRAQVMDFRWSDKQKKGGKAPDCLDAEDLKFRGDLCIAAFFGAGKDKDREALRIQYQAKLETWRQTGKGAPELRGIVEELRGGEKPVPPMHWEIEFPEVFGRENPGFDAMVGNPPFLGGKNIAQILGDVYLSSLKAFLTSNKGSLDLAAFFLHQMARLVRCDSAFGLIATKALIKGGTREGGLGSLVGRGFHITSATSPRMWPGGAAVHFVTVILTRGELEIERTLDGQPVVHINSHLKAHPEYKNPHVLAPCIVWSRGTTFLGEGFVLSAAEREELLTGSPESTAIIQQLMGGSDILGRADGRPSRFVINFGEADIHSASAYPAAFQRLVTTVKPQRDRLTRQIHEHCFWKHWDKRKELYAALAPMSQTVVFPMVSKHVVYSIAEDANSTVFSDQLGIIANGQLELFALMQSQVNIVWVLANSNRRGEGVRMSIRACLGTFPFPENWQTDPTLEAAGKTYYEFRAELMVRNDEGLTKTYNRFHDPNNNEPDIVKLRELHAAMDRAVLDAYGWDDISTDCEFLLDYAIDEETWGNKKKPYRYRWPEAVHDEVLARLLELNQQRYQEEVAQGLHEKRTRRVKHKS